LRSASLYLQPPSLHHRTKPFRDKEGGRYNALEFTMPEFSRGAWISMNVSEENYSTEIKG